MDHAGRHSNTATPRQGTNREILRLLTGLKEPSWTLAAAADLVKTDAQAGGTPHRSLEDRREPVPRLADAQVSDLIYRYQGGATVNTLASHFGIHRTTVLNHLERSGISRRRSDRKLTDVLVTLAGDYYREGHSLAQTGTKFGVDAATIRREFAKHGIQVRPRRGWPPQPAN